MSVVWLDSPAKHVFLPPIIPAGSENVMYYSLCPCFRWLGLKGEEYQREEERRGGRQRQETFIATREHVIFYHLAAEAVFLVWIRRRFCSVGPAASVHNPQRAEIRGLLVFLVLGRFDSLFWKDCSCFLVVVDLMGPVSLFCGIAFSFINGMGALCLFFLGGLFFGFLFWCGLEYGERISDLPL